MHLNRVELASFNSSGCRLVQNGESGWLRHIVRSVSDTFGDRVILRTALVCRLLEVKEHRPNPASKFLFRLRQPRATNGYALDRGLQKVDQPDVRCAPHLSRNCSDFLLLFGSLESPLPNCCGHSPYECKVETLTRNWRAIPLQQYDEDDDEEDEGEEDLEEELEELEEEEEEEGEEGEEGEEEEEEGGEEEEGEEEEEEEGGQGEEEEEGGEGEEEGAEEGDEEVGFRKGGFCSMNLC